MPRFVVIGVLAILTVLAGSGPAAAHASLVRTDPEDGATVRTVPRDVTVTFNENVSQVSLAMTAPDGSSVPVSDVHAVDTTVTGRVAATDQRGRYTLAYRVVSADGHPVSGVVTFTTTTGTVVDQAPTPDTSSFTDRHGTHILWGVAAAVLAVVLLLLPRWRRRRS